MLCPRCLARYAEEFQAFPDANSFRAVSVTIDDSDDNQEDVVDDEAEEEEHAKDQDGGSNLCFKTIYASECRGQIAEWDTERLQLLQFLSETSIVSEEDVFCPVEAFPAHKDPLGEAMVKEEANLGKFSLIVKCVCDGWKGHTTALT